MSFLNKIKNNSLGINTNPFTTERKAEKTVTTPLNKQQIDPFIAKKETGAPVTPVKPSFLGGVKPGVVNKPAGIPTGMPAAGKPAIPTMAKPTVVTPQKPAAAPSPVNQEATEATANPTPQEMIKDMESIDMKEPVKTEEKVLEPAKEEVKTEAVTEGKEESKAEEAAKDKTTKKKTTTKKKASTKTAKKTEVDEPIDEQLTETVETFFKMPRTTMKYSDAIQSVRGNFVDENWEEFRQSAIAESDAIVIESDMQEGAIKKTISKLSTLREKIWVQFMDTKTLLESLSNKDAEGLIERVKFVNLEGSNETARKKSGVLAVMNYKTDENENINLYELYDETKGRFYFLKGIMDTIQYKTQVLITMSSALKLEKNHINNHQ